MTIARLVPSTYSFSDTHYMSIENAYNMYNNVDNTSHAKITHSDKSTTTYYIYIKGFNFNAIPSDAVVNSFTVRFKAYERNLSTSISYQPKLCRITTVRPSGCPMPTTSTKVLTFTEVTDSWDTIKGYGKDFGIRVSVRRNRKDTQGYLYVYGAEIDVDYTIAEQEQLMLKTNGVWQDVQTVYKKVNGVWIEQTELVDVFSTTANYKKMS